MPRGRRLVALAAAFVLASTLWWFQNVSDPSSNGSDQATSSTAVGSPDQGVDPESSLPWIAESRLPPEARDTLALIDDGGPYPYAEDDETFGNREGVLPDRDHGYYREYTVDTPGLDHRGARRIVTGAKTEYYWTEDHYGSFSRIQRGDS